MPELPEVETIARGLAPYVVGRRIEEFSHARRPPLFLTQSLPPDVIRGHTISGVRRAGKYVVFDLDPPLWLAIHLRMTGTLRAGRGLAPGPATRAVLRLSGGVNVVFGDVRKFGRMCVGRGDIRDVLGIGVDPLSPTTTPQLVRRLTGRGTTPVKVWLLDQRKLAGVGNIYACEALYAAGVRPTRRVGKLSLTQLARLLAALRRVLRDAIRHGGSSVDDYLDAEGKAGRFQKHHRVYGRAGKPCRRCRTPIRRIVLAQRGTFYCPVCQH